MHTIIEIQSELQNLTSIPKISFAEIGKALGTGRANVSARAKSGSELNGIEIERIENYFNVKLKFDKLGKSNDDCIGLPVRGNLAASMGYGIEVYDESKTGTYYIDSRLLKALGANPETTDWVPCEGDSMSPTIESGSLLLVDKSKKEIIDGKIYCVRLNNALLAKRIQFIPPNSVKIVSDNSDKYDPFYVDFSKEIDFDFAIIGEVKHVITNMR